MTPYKLKIVTPDKIFFDGETEQITARTTTGNVGILAKHADYVANLPAGKLRIKIDGKFRDAAISGGVLKVSRDITTILAVAVEWADEIDINRAAAAKEKAAQALKKYNSGKEFDTAQAELKRALNRLSVASK